MLSKLVKSSGSLRSRCGKAGPMSDFEILYIVLMILGLIFTVKNKAE